MRVPALKAYVSDLSNVEALLQGPSDTKLPRFNMSRSIILSKIANQKWRNYPFTQRNKTKKAMGVEVGGAG